MFGKKDKAKEISLDDVKPMHPNEYPAKHLREKLDARRETLNEIHNHAASEGLEKDELK